MMWLVAQLWPFALVSCLAGFAVTWWAIVRSVPIDEAASGQEARYERDGASGGEPAPRRRTGAGVGESDGAGHAQSPGDVASRPRAVGHSLDGRRDGPIDLPSARPDEGVRAQPPTSSRRRAVAVGEAFAPRVEEEQSGHETAGVRGGSRRMQREAAIVIGEDEDMSDDFENDPYDESPVHQLDDDGSIDDDPEADDREPHDAELARGGQDARADSASDDARGWVERERRSRH